MVAAADAAYGAALAPALATARTAPDPESAVAAVVAALSRVAAEQPYFVRLLIHESFTGGPRLRRIVHSLAPLADAVTVLLERLHAGGRLPQFDPTSFLLFLVLTSSAPAALAGLTPHLATGRDDPTPTAEVVIRTLFSDWTGAVVDRQVHCPRRLLRATGGPGRRLLVVRSGSVSWPRSG